MNRVNPQQTALRNQHSEDKQSARWFINQNWQAPDNRHVPFDMNSTITYAVCTTLNSSVVLIAKGFESMFTHNGCFAGALIHQQAEENEALAQHIQESWENMAIRGNRDEVNKIAAHVLYRKVDDNWLFVPLPEANEENVVRFEIDDMVIWSHPPSDEPLMEVLRRNQQFTQAEEELTAIVNNANIPEDERVSEIRNTFLEMYSFYENLNRLPNSYVWPTLQLGRRTPIGVLQRFETDFSGVNEIYHKFHARGVQPRPSPTRETMYNLFTSSVEGFNLSLEEAEEVMRP